MKVKLIATLWTILLSLSALAQVNIDLKLIEKNGVINIVLANGFNAELDDETTYVLQVVEFVNGIDSVSFDYSIDNRVSYSALNKDTISASMFEDKEKMSVRCSYEIPQTGKVTAKKVYISNHLNFDLKRIIDPDIITQGMYPVLDAIQIHKLKDLDPSRSKNDFVAILSKYNEGGTNWSVTDQGGMSFEDRLKTLDSLGVIWNKYSTLSLGTEYNRRDPAPAPQGGQTEFQSTDGNSEQLRPVSQGGGLNNILFGITDFLIERTKTELNTAFFKKFKDKLDNNADLKDAFPSTFRILNLIDKEIYQYDLYINSLRDAFNKDLDNMIHAIQAVLENHSTEVYPANSGTKELVNAIFEVAYAIQQHESAGEALERFERLETNGLIADNKNLKSINGINALRTASFISQSLKGTNKEAYWVGYDEMDQLFRNEEIQNIYFALLALQLRHKPWANLEFYANNGTPVPSPHDLVSILEILANNTADTRAESIRKTFKDTYMMVDRIQLANKSHMNTIKTIKKQIENGAYSNEELKAMRNELFDAHYQMFNNYIDLIGVSGNFYKAIIPDHSKEVEDFNKYIQSFEYAGETAIKIIHRQYSGAITSASLLLDELLPKDSKSKATIAGMLKYGSFMANMAEAESPSDVKKVIETVALPPGSYSIKRHNRFTVSINGYLGAFYGSEQIDGVSNKPFNNVSLTAPIGLSIDLGSIAKYKNRWKNPNSWGLSIPLVDLGTLASFRFQNSSDTIVSSVPNIQLSQILAPGIFLEWGIGGTPLTLGVGAQVGPMLREILPGAESNNIGDHYIRYGATLKVDIPLWTISTREAPIYILDEYSNDTRIEKNQEIVEYIKSIEERELHATDYSLHKLKDFLGKRYGEERGIKKTIEPKNKCAARRAFRKINNKLKSTDKINNEIKNSSPINKCRLKRRINNIERKKEKIEYNFIKLIYSIEYTP